MKILLIQSDHVYLNLLRRILVERRYTINVATDGYTGFAMALHARFDLIILDTSLPRLNGLEVVRRLRQEMIQRQLYSHLLSMIPPTKPGDFTPEPTIIS